MYPVGLGNTWILTDFAQDLPGHWFGGHSVISELVLTFQSTSPRNNIH